MNQKLHRILLARIKPRRPDQEALHLGLILAVNQKDSRCWKVKLSKQRIVQDA